MKLPVKSSLSGAWLDSQLRLKFNVFLDAPWREHICVNGHIVDHYGLRIYITMIT